MSCISKLIVSIIWFTLPWFQLTHGFLGPISATVAFGTAASSAFLMLAELSGLTSIRCTFNMVECCKEPAIQFNQTGLHYDLHENLYGQHLVTSTVYKAVSSHLKTEYPPKPLVMSFHGWTGGGKNYVARMIIRNLYRDHEKSSFVHVFNAEVEFKHKDPYSIAKYKDYIQNWISGNVTKCGRSIFVFDEMDHMPEGVVDSIKPFLGSEPSFRGVDYRKSIFLFLSNTGGEAVVNKCKNWWETGGNREDIKLSDMQSILEKSAYNQDSGFRRSGLIERNMIDHFIPFLPLMRHHVERCVKDEIRRRNLDPSDYNLKDILDELGWFPQKLQLYSKSGCKKISNKVSLHVES